MKTTLLSALIFSILCLLPFSGMGQDFRPLNPVVWPESDKDTLHYTVQGYRHGMSVLTQYRHPEVEYEAGEVLTWDRYHTPEVMYAWVKRWISRYPDLTDFYSPIRRLENTPISRQPSSRGGAIRAK